VDTWTYIAVGLMGYFAGSLPTGYLLARAKGVDIRKTGSGNIGATNVFRVLGKPAGVLVMVVDGLKGYAACAWGTDAMLHLLGATPATAEPFRIVAGIAAVLGHSFTCWLRFKGGKGVATSAGVYFALAPMAAGVAVGTWVTALLITRYVSVASILAAVALPLTVWLTPNSLALRIVTTALGAMVIWKHRSNVQRLLSGTENRFGKKAQTTEAAR
jgi:glycerol-3-phosphate acyltransferase PlsY